MLIGYARVSTKHQNLDRQLGALRAAGYELLLAEKSSGKDVKSRRELGRASQHGCEVEVTQDVDTHSLGDREHVVSSRVQPCGSATFGRLAFQIRVIEWCACATKRFSGSANRGTKGMSRACVVLLGRRPWWN